MMTSHNRYSCLFVALGLAMCADTLGAAVETADSAQAKAKLADVRARIEALTDRLGAQLKDRDAQASRLRDSDLRLTTQRQRFESLRNAQLALERRRAELRAEQERTQAALEAQRVVLASQVRAAYMIGPQAQLKLLLTQSDAAAAGRMLAFYGYFARQRAAQIEEIRLRVARAQTLVIQIDESDAKLQSLRADTAREVMLLQSARKERVAALAALTTQVSSGHQELVQLKRDEQAKESLVADLTRVLQDFPVDTQQSFDSMRGKLPWPVSGSVAARYQEPQRASAGPSGLRLNGVQIQSARGAKVRAAYFGRVVYADWLQGLGLLLIIGHGGNYMTLYGHAEVLYKSVGDWVAPGDVVAAMSDSGVAAPQLHFEIRNGRKTEDPTQWLKASP